MILIYLGNKTAFPLPGWAPVRTSHHDCGRVGLEGCLAGSRGASSIPDWKILPDVRLL